MAQSDQSRYYDKSRTQPAPSLNVQQASPQSSPYSRTGPSSPYAPSSSSGPGGVPTLSTNFSYDSSSQRSATHHGPSHSYSRSSPSAGVDQKYIPFPGTPESAKASGSSGSRGVDPRTPTGASYSPLALADIRPRADLHMEELLSPSAPAAYGSNITQKTSSYLAPWPIYAYDWCNWPVPSGAGAGKMAICSYLEDPHNFIQILDTYPEPQDHNLGSSSPNHALSFTRIAEATCSYPVTRILWEPPSSQKQSTDLLATSGDHLRLWSLPASLSNSSAHPQSNNISRSSASNRKPPPAEKLTPLALLSNSKTPEHTAPLTSLDWNASSPKLIITSSIDTTCTIWDIPTLTAKTQLIAHDKEVFDVRFCASSVDTFVSCGADGSVRMFDLRSLEHSTIIYEPSEKNATPSGPSPSVPLSPGGAQQSLINAPPLLRLATSPHDSHLLATFAGDSRIIRILDHRQPGQALLELHGHSAALSCVEWSSSRRGMLASGADDSQVLYWDLINPSNGAQLPPSGTMSDGHGGWAEGAASGSSGGGVAVSAGADGGSSTAHGGTAAAGNTAAASSSVKGPAASWRCDYEVVNVSFGPQSDITGQGGEWLGVVGGRGVWGVKI